MAPATIHISLIAPPLARYSLVHTAFLLSLWLLVAQGAGSPAKATPLTRPERDAGCAQECTHLSDMSRCLRMACRKSAMGALIRFGKRDRGSVAAGDEEGAGSDLSQREDILEKLLSGDQASQSHDLVEDVDEQHQGGQLESDNGSARQSLDGPEWLLSPAPQIASLKSRHRVLPRNDNQLLMWLLQASRGLRQHRPMQTDGGNMFKLPLPPSGSSHPGQQGPADQEEEELRVRSANYWDTEPSLSHGGLSYGFSSLTYNDLPGMLGKRTSYSSAMTDQKLARAITHPGQQMQRYQRGLLKHLIRFG